MINSNLQNISLEQLKYRFQRIFHYIMQFSFCLKLHNVYTMMSVRLDLCLMSKPRLHCEDRPSEALNLIEVGNDSLKY